MVKLSHVAERVGLGVSTVSAVLNGKAYCYVSEAKRQLILRTAEEMGYMPNRMSRGIQGLPTNTIGIIASLFTVPVASRLIDKIVSITGSHGYFAILGDPSHDAGGEKKVVNELLSRGVDGLLIQSGMGKLELDGIIKGRVPYVCMNQNFDGLNVTMSRADGAAMAVKHLIEVHNHKDIGFVVAGSHVGEKYDGYKSALSERGIQPRKDFVFEVPSELDASSAVDKILSRGARAVLCSNDFVAGHLVRKLFEAGARVPDDVAVVGFDGLDIICEIIRPPLTSVRQPFEAIAETAFNLLLDKLKGLDVDERTHLIPPVLRIGESCGCAGRHPGRSKTTKRKSERTKGSVK